MGIKNPYRNALSDELEHWSGVIVDFEDSTNHQKATFYVGTQKRFIHMSRGTKKMDAGRAMKNFRAELRRMLRELGAQELA